MIKGLISLGYQKIITTPHNQADIYKNPESLIKTRLNELREFLCKQNITIEIEADAKEVAEAIIADACKKMLSNQIMESFEFTIKQVK
jgi:phosphoribosylformylglycinamidine (FGAM) synthase PurS component